MPYYTKDPKKDHNFDDNRPYTHYFGIRSMIMGTWAVQVRPTGLQARDLRNSSLLVVLKPTPIGDLGMKIIPTLGLTVYR